LISIDGAISSEIDREEEEEKKREEGGSFHKLSCTQCTWTKAEKKKNTERESSQAPSACILLSLI
jgi:hypothetical protein